MVQKLLAAIMAYVIAAKGRAGELNAWLAEQLVQTIEAADKDLPTPAGAMTRQMAMDSRGQLGLGTVLAAFVLVIAAMVVLIVVDRFDQSLGSPSSSALSSAEGDILSGFGDMASLIGPLLLIAIGVVIIGLIRRVQGQ